MKTEMTEQDFITHFKEQGFELYKTEDLKPKLDRLEELEKGWISVDIQTPPHLQNVLLFVGKREFPNDDLIVKGYYNETYALYTIPEAGDEEYLRVHYWMPLPKSPNELSTHKTN
jgi:hypothetical protein